MTTLKRVTIALLGVAGTGKKNLAQALEQAFASTPTTTVPRHWQITTDTPLQRLVEQIQASASAPDSTGLDTEATEFQAAMAQQRRFDHSLLLGLDLTPSARTLNLQSTRERSSLDTLLRRALTQGDVPFQVIYGTGGERLQQALLALGALKSPATQLGIPPAKTPNPRKPWVWACDKCSDPGCEHQLLSALLLNR